jgi:hypothetical protein
MFFYVTPPEPSPTTSPTVSPSPASSIEPQPTFVTYQPIAKLDTLINNFELPKGENNLSLNFIAPSWNIDFNFVVSEDVMVGEVYRSLLEHFSLKEHVAYDLSGLNAGYRCSFEDVWILTANGKDVFSPAWVLGNSNTLREAKVNSGDLLSFTNIWTKRCVLTTNSNDSDQEEAPIKYPPVLKH